MNDNLKNAYRHQRARDVTLTARAAIRYAREDVANNTTRSHYNDTGSAGAAFKSGSATLRFIENPAALGFRFMGYADEIAPRLVQHEGWFTSHYGWETGDKVRGAVWLLPGKDGSARTVAGFIDSNNEDAALIECEVCEEIDARAEDVFRWDKSDMRDSAARADSLAERYAEDARDYDRAWQAGAMYAHNCEEITELRKRAREVAVASRDNVKNNDVICRTLRDKVESLRDDIRDLVKANRELKDGDHSRGDDYLGFYTGAVEMRAAFNDGAGREII